ncbi:hypothetical protein QBA54_32185 [Streptomyces sp. B21-108]|uniref:hypothetical protein n=1 Tax=Streptomyces sp. B21-108 TaxID=3039419 RepID=UPI002FEE924B
MRLIPLRVRRHFKRRQHARVWRRIEYFAFECAHPVTWCRIRTWNNAARIWDCHPERPRKDPR